MASETLSREHKDAGCCGPAAVEAEASCPCAGAVKGHKLAFIGILTAVAAAFLISQVGGILGIIAFIRTL